MKNFSVCVILICIICSCQNLADHDENAAEVIKEDVVQDSSGDAFGLHEYPADAGLNHRTMSSCGGYYSGDYFTLNKYYAYPLQKLDIDCAALNSTINVTFKAAEIPNKFDIVKGSTVVAQSTSSAGGWLGYATYPGNWGTSVNGPSTKNLSFVKTENKYYLQVSTQTPPNSYDYYPTMDRWEVRVGC